MLCVVLQASATAAALQQAVIDAQTKRDQMLDRLEATEAKPHPHRPLARCIFFVVAGSSKRATCARWAARNGGTAACGLRIGSRKEGCRHYVRPGADPSLCCRALWVMRWCRAVRLRVIWLDWLG